MSEKVLPRMRTIPEIAATGLLSGYALRLLVREGKVPYVRVGRKILVNYDGLLRVLEEGTGAERESHDRG